jgi:hypothetical protein
VDQILDQTNFYAMRCLEVTELEHNIQAKHWSEIDVAEFNPNIAALIISGTIPNQEKNGTWPKNAISDSPVYDKMLHGRFFLLMKFLYLNDKEFEKEKLKKL